MIVIDGSYESLRVACNDFFCWLLFAMDCNFCFLARCVMYIAKCVWVYTFGDFYWEVLNGSRRDSYR